MVALFLYILNKFIYDSYVNTGNFSFTLFTLWQSVALLKHPLLHNIQYVGVTMGVAGLSQN